MFKILMMLVFCCGGLCIAGLPKYPHPLDFKGTKAEKAQVVAYIKASVKYDHPNGSNNLLRILENGQLDAYRSLTKVDNHELVRKVIRTHPGGSFNLWFILYKGEVRASKQKLEW